MYLDYFALKEFPFSIAPDPRYLYMSERHREALAHLLFGVGGQGGFVVLTGEVGTGKTTICRCFLNQVPENTDVAFIVNPKLSARELLASICDELGVQYQDSSSIKVLNDALNSYLLDAHAKGRHTVLIVDEAQNLRVDVLEQLRLLTNLETSEKKLLQIILLGQPELRDLLARSELRQLAQRVTARYHLDALNQVEVGAYLKCRLSVAGRASTVFSKSAVQKLYKLSGGIPRLINLIADRSMLGAYASHAELVDGSHVKQAYQEIQGEGGKRLGKLSFLRFGLGLMLVAMVFGTGAWAYFAYSESIPIVKVVEQHENQTEVVIKDRRASANAEVATEPQAATGGQEFLDGFEAALGATENPVLAYQEASSPVTQGGAFTQNSAFTPGSDQVPQSETAQTLPPSNQRGSNNQSVADKVEAAGFPFLETLGERQNNDKSRFFAFKSLYKEWGVFYPSEPFMLACKFAELNDLKCLHKQGNWRSLLRLNRPAVLTLLNESGEEITVALLKIEGERAKVAHNESEFWVTMDEVDRYWLGEYSVLFQLPPYRTRTIRPGQPNEEEWLRTQFDEILAERILRNFEPSLSSQPLPELVSGFQRAVGLVPDGIAGSMTIIHINTVLKRSSPRLLGGV